MTRATCGQISIYGGSGESLYPPFHVQCSKVDLTKLGFRILDFKMNSRWWNTAV